ncbi:MAG: hypothetical protein KC931_25430, partial [Candidatus Omnitrophica bacterium]|nr:hypothetical protein [Candidatus Omnitrophota bacterium]
MSNAGKVNGTILTGNGVDSGYDYEDTRSRSVHAEVDVSGNYWGSETTAFMNANPWGSLANVPRIYDFFDNVNRTAANYDNHLQSGGNAGPDLTPPAFLLSATPNLSNAVNVGVTEFILEFNEPMDNTVQPVVTFDTEFPFTELVVEPVGWTTATFPSSTWRGSFSVGIETGDGLHTMRVSGAKAADGFEIPDDTSHRFLIDTRPGTGISNGVATPLSHREMRLEWTPSLDIDVKGFQILRARSLTGVYNYVAAAPAEMTMTIDSGLDSDTT